MVKELDEYSYDTEKYSKPYHDPDLLYQLYWEENLSQSEISDVIDCCSSTVNNWMKKHDIPARKPDDEKYPRPRTQSEYASSAGYEVIVHNHINEKYQVQHHRLIAVAEWGLDDLKNNHVHHKNGIPWDNRICNLEIKTPEAHSRHHRLTEKYNEKWHNKDLLYQEYILNEKTMKEIANMWDCNSVTIHNWLHRFNIPTRPKANSQ